LTAKLFSDLYVTKLLDISTKFFPCMVIYILRPDRNSASNFAILSSRVRFTFILRSVRIRACRRSYRSVKLILF